MNQLTAPDMNHSAASDKYSKNGNDYIADEFLVENHQDHPTFDANPELTNTILTFLAAL